MLDVKLDLIAKEFHRQALIADGIDLHLIEDSPEVPGKLLKF